MVNTRHHDGAGILIALLCFAHCVAGPVLLTVAGFSSLIKISERFEPVFLLGSAAMGALALVPGYRKKHGRLSCLAVFGCGILCLLLRRQLGSIALAGELIATGIGATLIVGAHLLNLKFSRHCECCKETAPSRSRLDNNL